MITSVDEFLPIKLHYPLITWSCKIIWQNHCISTNTVSMATKLARMVIYLIRLLIIKSYKIFTTMGCKATWQKILYISITRVPMANKPGRMMNSLDRLLPIMSHDPLIRWPYETRGSLIGGGSTRKHLSRHRLLIINCAKKKWNSTEKDRKKP